MVVAPSWVLTHFLILLALDLCFWAFAERGEQGWGVWVRSNCVARHGGRRACLGCWRSGPKGWEGEGVPMKLAAGLCPAELCCDAMGEGITQLSGE